MRLRYRWLSVIWVLVVGPLCHGEPLTVMPLGDSITGGFHGPVEARGSYRLELEKLLTLHDIEFDYVGQFHSAFDGLIDGDYQARGGYRIEQMVDEFGPAIAEYQPDVALILAGTNNHWDEPVKADFIARYENLIELVHSHAPEADIVLATVPNFGCCQSETVYWTPEWVNERNEVRIPNMNAALVEVAGRYDFVQWVDFNAVLDPETDLVDHVHPNVYGHRKLASLFFDAITSVDRAVVDVVRVDGLMKAMREGTYHAEFDLDDSGSVDSADLQHLVEVELKTSFGDANLDGLFESTDLVSVFKLGEFMDDIPANSLWSEGDWNGDADFTQTDLDLALTAGAYELGYRRAPTVVPEPSAVWLLALSAAALASGRSTRRRQRRSPD